MDPTSLLLATFLLSVGGLFAFIWSLRKGLFDLESGWRAHHLRGWRDRPSGGAIERCPRSSMRCGPAPRPAGSPASAAAAARADLEAELAARHEADRSSSPPALLMLSCAVVWLLVVASRPPGCSSSLKLHMPDLLTGQAWLSFGRLRTMHLNAVAYGWAADGAVSG
ncbi:hypothetical protein ACU4GH_15440 [Bradyrhizobium betae]